MQSRDWSARTFTLIEAVGAGHSLSLGRLARNVGSLSKLRTARYGFSRNTNFNAWVAVHVQGDITARVILLSSFTAPFAHVRCEDPVGLVPLEGKRFIFVYDVGDGNRQLQSVDLNVD